MKKYNKPEVKITVLNNEDILMISAVGINLTNFISNNSENNGGKSYTSINF